MPHMHCGYCVRLVLWYLFILLIPLSSSAHGLAGKRFFPTTLAIDDPFVSDEFSLLGGHIKEPGEGEEPSARTTEFSYEWAKRITPSLGLSIEQGYLNLKPEGEETKKRVRESRTGDQIPVLYERGA